jgi:hypothetical protein
MKSILLPGLLFALGLAGGVGAGLALGPRAAPDPGGELGASAEAEPPPPAPPGARDFVRINNQFVVPVVAEGEVALLVILSLSVEVPAGREQEALLVEPRLRDTFLQVLFDHANSGGFDGVFTAASPMGALRRALLAGARDEVGDLVTDVLIIDLVRQDV